METNKLEAFRYKRGQLLVLDQLKLPAKHEYIDVKTVDEGWTVINTMQVRGAPAIGIAALLSLAVDLNATDNQAWKSSTASLEEWIGRKLDHLVTSRPTGVNLKIECTALKDYVVSLRHQELSAEDLKEKVLEKCEELLPRDIADNLTMGQHGANAILKNIKSDKKVRVLTHCNTGSLATGGYGTALGVIRALRDLGRLQMSYCTETRPYNQGSRLTAFELTYEDIPARLICDSAVSALMASEEIDAVVVGADRIARNGDTANKIGTYQIAITAKYHGVPFFVAAPTATIDLSTLSGQSIPIEDRCGQEITHCKCDNKTRIAPQDIQCWNPAFDVTPASLITGGIITQMGVVMPPVDTRENLQLLDMH